jgi:uncharacterized membrane protein YdbT with pleckstrin-like domain
MITRAMPAFAPVLRPLEVASATGVAEAELEDVAWAFAADEMDEEAIVEDAAADEVRTTEDDVTSDDEEDEDRAAAVDFAVGDKVLVTLAEDVDVVLVLALAVGDVDLAFAVVVLSSSSLLSVLVDLFAAVVGLAPFAVVESAPRVTKPAVGPEKVAEAVT